MKAKKAPRLVTVAITTTITIIFWIFFTLYQVLTTKPSPSVDPELLQTIDPTLDVTSLGELRNKVFFEEGSFIPLRIEDDVEEDTFVIPEESEPVAAEEVTPDEDVENLSQENAEEEISESTIPE